MERGLSRRSDLIRELRATHALQTAAMEERGRDRRRTLCMQRIRDVAGQQVRGVRGYWGGRHWMAEGDTAIG